MDYGVVFFWDEEDVVDCWVDDCFFVNVWEVCVGVDVYDILDCVWVVVYYFEVEGFFDDVVCVVIVLFI